MVMNHNRKPTDLTLLYQNLKDGTLMRQASALPGPSRLRCGDMFPEVKMQGGTKVSKSSVLDDIVDVSVVMGEGAFSIGEDLYYGAKRTGQGLGVSGTNRMEEIGFENSAIKLHLLNLLKFGVSEGSPLLLIVFLILNHYFEKIPKRVQESIGKMLLLIGGHTVGRMVIGKAIAKAVAKKIAEKIATKAAYKQFAKKIGVSAAAGSTAIITAPVTLLILQGTAQRASEASARLKRKLPELYQVLRDKDRLDLLFFLVEKPLEKHLNMILFATRNPLKFNLQIEKLEKKLAESEK